MTAIAERRGAYPEEHVHGGTKVLYKASHSDRVPRMSLVTDGYLALPRLSMAWPLQTVSKTS
jgi:hypothetical protein